MFSYDVKIRVPRWLIKGLTLASNTEKKEKRERNKKLRPPFSGASTQKNSIKNW